MQVRQIAGMRGLVANPRGDMIPRPIKSNFREGLSMLEYFIATPGARKGLVDTALRTADSGYLTRRLVDVAQELIINDEDPTAERDGDPVRGLWVEDVVPDTAGKRSYLETRIFGRTLADDVKLADGTDVSRPAPSSARTTIDAAARRSRRSTGCGCARRSPTSPTSASAPRCYGRSLATGKHIEMGEAVGVIAAQSIGEPGTQLTMRTFHTGGIAGTDIAGGLPRVVELFEARSPKGKATLARTSRRRAHRATTRARAASSRSSATTAPRTPTRSRACPASRSPRARRSPPATRSSTAPATRRSSSRSRASARPSSTSSSEVQKVYRDQGVSIHDKHIELIVRQMTRRVGVQEPGDSPLPARRARRPEGLRRRQPPARAGGQGARRGPARDDGHHQGLAGHRLVAVRRLLPGDDAGAHRGGHRVEERRAPRPEGEHHHRQAHPGRHRQLGLQGHRDRAPPTTSRWTTGPPRARTRTSPTGSPRATSPAPSARGRRRRAPVEPVGGDDGPDEDEQAG